MGCSTERTPLAKAAAPHRMGLSQAKMAAELGIAQSTLGDYELDKCEPQRPLETDA